MGSLRLRAATVDDAAFVADVRTAVRPAYPVDPVVERYWWSMPEGTSTTCIQAGLSGDSRSKYA